MLKAGNKSLL